MSEWSQRFRTKGTVLAQAWAELMGRMPWEHFVTLTFDPKRVYPVTQHVASTEAFWWCSQTAHVSRSRLGWLYATERTPSGTHHVHVLLIGIGDSLGAAPVAMWRQRNGFIDARPVSEQIGAVLYTTKEAATTGEVVFSDTLHSLLTTHRAGDRQRTVKLHP